MSESPPETVIREFPSITILWEDNQPRAAGNLVLTSERLIFLKQVALNERKSEMLQKLSQEGNTTELLKYALTLNKNNFQIPLTSIARARTGFLPRIPVTLSMKVTYYTVGKKKKGIAFVFKSPILKVLFRSEPLTWIWARTVRKAVKLKKKLVQLEAAKQAVEVNGHADTK